MRSSRQYLRLLALALALSQALSGGSAYGRGSGENESARSERSQATVAVNLGRYDEAAEHFSNAYSLTQDPTLLFGLAQAYRLAGKPEKALAAYSAFLRAASSSPKLRPQIERAAAEIESITSFMLNLRASGQHSAGKPNGRAGAVEPAGDPDLELTPPPLTEKEHAGKISPEPAVARTEPLVLLPKPEPVPAPALILTAEASPPAEPGNRPVYKRWWFWTGVAAALALGGVATWWYTQPGSQAPASTYGSVRVLP
jgi:tetratricopeptide (TPR) repeat protein